VARPPKYETPEEMERIIDLYFLACKSNQTEDTSPLGELSDEEMELINSFGNPVVPTVSGLAFALGMSRQALLDYQKKDEFLDTVKRAKQRIELEVEQRLFGNSVTGVIFNLKNNFGWKDKMETEHSGNVGLSHILDDIDGRSSGLPDASE
jgi:hypothetical protein